MTAPRVYAAINAVTAALAAQGVAKARFNRDDDYLYRSIDDVVERLAPLLAQHQLCILPRVLERSEVARQAEGETLLHVTLRLALDLVSAEDGSVHVIETVGEALDASDKASAKAMTAAYKHGVLHAFCVPAKGREDPDALSPRLHRPSALVPAPVEGWVQWAEDIATVVGSCACGEAIDRLLASNRAQLGELAREQPTLYQELGRAIADRRSVLARRVAADVNSAPSASPSRARRTRRLAPKSEARAERKDARAAQLVRKRAGNPLTIEAAPKPRSARMRSKSRPIRRPEPAPGSAEKGVLEHV